MELVNLLDSECLCGVVFCDFVVGVVLFGFGFVMGGSSFCGLFDGVDLFFDVFVLVWIGWGVFWFICVC